MSKEKTLEALPYYRWLWRDWRANRRIQRMSWQARGLYRELLDEFWAEGSIPDDLAELADICACTLAELQAYWPEIEPCWERVEGGYRNEKMDSQRTAKDAERVAKSKSGRKGGKACNSRTRAEAAEASESNCLASAKEMQAQPDIAVAIAEQEHKQKPAAQAPFVLPDWIDVTAWEAHQEARKKKRAANTPLAKKLLVNELSKIRAAGHDANAALLKSARSGWADVYMPSGAPVATGQEPTRRYMEEAA